MKTAIAYIIKLTLICMVLLMKYRYEAHKFINNIKTNL